MIEQSREGIGWVKRHTKMFDCLAMSSTTYLKWVRIISYLIRCQRIGIITSLNPWFSNRETDSKCYHNQKEVKSECSQDIYMNARMQVLIWCWFLSASVKSSQLLLTQQKITLPSVQFSHSVVSNSVIPWTVARQASLEPPGAYTNSCPSRWWCHPTIILCCPLLLLPSIFPSIRAFSSELILHIRWPRYWNFSSASVFPMNIQDWFPSGWTGWISLQSKGLSRVFSNTTVQKHQFFGTQLSSQSNSHIHTWPLEKP